MSIPASTCLDTASLTAAAIVNPGLREAYEHWQATRQRRAQVTALPETVVRYRDWIQELESAEGETDYGFGVIQTFPFPGKLGLAGEEADREAEAARAHHEAVYIELAADVKQAWYELYYVHRAIELTERRRDYVSSIARCT